MNMRDLIPWRRSESNTPTLYRDADPFMALHREVNRLFDNMFHDFESLGTGRFPNLASGRANWGWPNVEVSETEKDVRVTAELPGLEEKDVEVLLDDNVLTLRGERRSETEDKDRQFSERYYGQFERRIALGTEIEEDKVEARFKNGVLTITMPKTERAQSRTRRIAITGK
ncbi:Hsp20/alpha crystallin family protein [Dongia deserti]|uniref:Hsp20/alpha crystallin family protein n=1 Tax=Dongia deserti TaxID=2268030 RepID=UPI000E658A24|nr:Hsp20/alpha crystallin family protein [Dongia deserti]